MGGPYFHMTPGVPIFGSAGSPMTPAVKTDSSSF